MEIISQSCMQIASGNILVVTDGFRECGGERYMGIGILLYIIILSLILTLISWKINFKDLKRIQLLITLLVVISFLIVFCVMVGIIWCGYISIKRISIKQDDKLNI